MENGRIWVPWPEPRPWLARVSAAPWVYGSLDNLLVSLRALLVELDRDSTLDRRVALSGGVDVTVREATRALGPCGLIARARQGAVILTEEAKRFLDSGDDLYLMALIHAHVRFFGEALYELSQSQTHQQLNDVAASKYGMTWKSLDQVRRRVSWLRAAGLVERWRNNQLTRTRLGTEFCEQLRLVDLDELPHRRPAITGTVNLSSPPAAIGVKLDELDEHALLSRRQRLGYVAGGDIIATLTRLVGAAVPQITHPDFISFCTSEFSVKKSSAEQTLQTLQSVGLMIQVSSDSLSPTEIALEWLASDDPIDLLRILHVNLALVGETLDALKHADETGEIVRHLARLSPEMGLSREQVLRRLRLLHEAGLVEKVGYGRQQITAKGQAFCDSLPILTPEVSSEEGLVQADVSTETVSRTAAMIQELSAELLEASTYSRDYRRLEQAIEDVCRAFGLEVECHSGPNKTDRVAILWMSSTERRRIAIDAKSDGAGVVGARDIETDTLIEHKEKHKADEVVVVGPGFEPRARTKAAARNIASITATRLAGWLMRQRQAPLSARELAPMFSVDGQDTLEATWDRVERRQGVLRHVLQLLWRTANDPREVQQNQGGLIVREVWRDTANSLDIDLDVKEIEEALEFLSGPYIAGVTILSQGSYVAAAAPFVTSARLRALADALDADSGGSRARRGAPDLPAIRSAKAAPKPGSGMIAPGDVRAWARQQGRQVSDRGRLSARLVEDYLEAQSGGDRLI